MKAPRRPDATSPSAGAQPPRTRTARATVWMASHKVLTGIAILVLAATIANASGTDIAPPKASGSTAPTGPTGSDAVPVVPDLEGLSLDAAQASLAAADIVVEVEVKEEYSKAESGTVFKVTPGVGIELESGDTVTLFIALAYPTVPRVVGKKVAAAIAALREAGFRVDVKKKISALPAGTVLKVSPRAGTELLPGQTVTLVIAKEAPVQPSCHPSYEGACLSPTASDYDCAGGSGNGPLYTGFVYVVGPDVFGLDADNDGYGCE